MGMGGRSGGADESGDEKRAKTGVMERLRWRVGQGEKKRTHIVPALFRSNIVSLYIIVLQHGIAPCLHDVRTAAYI